VTRHDRPPLPRRLWSPCDRRRPALGEPTRRDHRARTRHDPPAEPRAWPRPVARPTGRRPEPRTRTHRGERRIREAVTTPSTFEPAEGLGVTLDGGVLHLRLERPDKRNALSD